MGKSCSTAQPVLQPLPSHIIKLSEIHLAELEIPHPKARVLKLCDCISVTQQAEENNLEKVQKLNGSSPFSPFVCQDSACSR